MKRPDNVIAIDPDVSKSGVAYLKTSSRQLEVSSLTFEQLIDYLKEVKNISEHSGESVVVVVEASWTSSHNRHIGTQQSSAVVAKTGYNVGRNHQIGIDICSVVKNIGLEVIEQPPLRKCWKGKDGKITHEELASFTGLMGKTNQDARDAALLAWVFAELPIKVKY